MKHILVLLSIILALIPAVYAEDDKWIDGIRFRYGIYNNLLEVYNKHKIMERSDKIISHRDKTLVPLTIELAESVISNWIYYGTSLDIVSYEFLDLLPGSVKDSDSGNTIQQPESVRGYLEDNYFNSDDKSFIVGKNNWALSGDFKLQGIYFGIFFGIFYPSSETNRFFKIGVGPSVYYRDLSFSLKLCEEYHVKTITEPKKMYEPKCKGEKEIDNIKKSEFGFLGLSKFTVWERRTINSIWRFFDFTAFAGDHQEYKLKRHPSLGLNQFLGHVEWISYTYRF